MPDIRETNPITPVWPGKRLKPVSRQDKQSEQQGNKRKGNADKRNEKPDPRIDEYA